MLLNRVVTRSSRAQRGLTPVYQRRRNGYLALRGSTHFSTAYKHVFRELLAIWKNTFGTAQKHASSALLAREEGRVPPFSPSDRPSSQWAAPPPKALAPFDPRRAGAWGSGRGGGPGVQLVHLGGPPLRKQSDPLQLGFLGFCGRLALCAAIPERRQDTPRKIGSGEGGCKDQALFERHRIKGVLCRHPSAPQNRLEQTRHKTILRLYLALYWAANGWQLALVTSDGSQTQRRW